MLPTSVRHGLLTDYGHGIHAIDSGFGGLQSDAVHVVIQDGRAALIDTAVNASVPRVLDALRSVGIAADAVDYVLLTHVHLDHAGGTGLLMQHLPSATLVVHSRGARHMIDPSKLSIATHAVYGADKARRMYGEILPVAANRVREVGDGATVDLNGREFLILDTPGHARHHVCFRDALTGHVFTGDTFGFALPVFDSGNTRHVFPTLTPTQLEPNRLKASIDRIVALDPEAVYVTHYGRAGDVVRLGADLHRLIDAQVAIAMAARHLGRERKDRIMAGIADLIDHESHRSHWQLQGQEAVHRLASDVELNAQGLGIWLDSLEEK